MCCRQVCLLNPLGLLLSVPPGTGLQAFTWLDMGQRACMRVSCGLLLPGLCAAKQEQWLGELDLTWDLAHCALSFCAAGVPTLIKCAQLSPLLQEARLPQKQDYCAAGMPKSQQSVPPANLPVLAACALAPGCKHLPRPMSYHCYNPSADPWRCAAVLRRLHTC